MAQNVYDDPEFFDRYGQLGRSRHGLEGAPEWPSLRAMLPDVTALRVVDLGCGYGWFCRWARRQGAGPVLGIDLSERMIAQAAAMSADAGITYERRDLEQLELPSGQFELAYSSLALHYVEDIGRLLMTVHRALVPGGLLVLSTEHPIFTAPRQPGWLRPADGDRTWPVDQYLLEGPRKTEWLGQSVIKQHRTLGTTLNALIGAGFGIRRVEEWRPTDAQVAADPALGAELERPMFILVSAQRPIGLG